MRKGIVVLASLLCLGASPGFAQDQKADPFKGKLFAPNVILEHRDELKLTKQQFTDIRVAVVDVQANVAEFEWDVAEAYQLLMAELDKSPIDENVVLQHVNAALKAENEVKKLQVAMLVRLKNLLTDEQIGYLESVKDE